MIVFLYNCIYNKYEGDNMHLAIIMDGNGRYGKKKYFSRSMGHRDGAEKLYDVCKWCFNLGIDYLTVYAFSTENWKRPANEVEYLMSLPAIFIDKYLSQLMKNDIKIDTIGDLSALPEKTVKVLQRAIETTANNKTMTLVFALNYGGRSDIVNAVNSFINEKPNVKISEEDINQRISTHLYPDVDLMIRTSLDYRLSNFLLWQLSYAELCFVDCYWPDFSGDKFEKVVEDYKSRQRRFGGLV